MSTYYDYYLAIKKEDGKVYPIGLYSKDGKLLSVYSTNGHWGGLQDDFWDLPDSQASEELVRKFTIHGSDGKPCLMLRYMPLKDVYARAKDGGLQFGYVPTRLISAEEKHKVNPYKYDSVADSLACDAISPIEYSALSEKNREKYAYYAWLDTESAAYEASQIGSMATELVYQLTGLFENDNIVVLMNIC